MIFSYNRKTYFYSTLRKQYRTNYYYQAPAKYLFQVLLCIRRGSLRGHALVLRGHAILLLRDHALVTALPRIIFAWARIIIIVWPHISHCVGTHYSLRGHALVIAWARIIIAWARIVIAWACIIIAWARIIIAWARIIIAWPRIIIAWPRISHCVGTHRSLRGHALVIAWARIIIALARIIIAWARNNVFNIHFILGHSWPLWATVRGHVIIFIFTYNYRYYFRLSPMHTYSGIRPIFF